MVLRVEGRHSNLILFGNPVSNSHDNYLLIYLPSYLSIYPPSYLPTYLYTFTYSYTFPPTYLLTYLSTWLQSYLSKHLLTYLPTYLLTYLSNFKQSFIDFYQQNKCFNSNTCYVCKRIEESKDDFTKERIKRLKRVKDIIKHKGCQRKNDAN